ncbi:glycosyltransferase [Patescibacteria group bacterium]|nr:glycosyltransferase [Patescibacteria group bacterium]MBU1256199.1 glycosyltransferase [Patescibacteria group bacterium]MBU1457725.1 glycosyltransferase [Patescibacteria group bacterium]
MNSKKHFQSQYKNVAFPPPTERRFVLYSDIIWEVFKKSLTFRKKMRLEDKFSVLFVGRMIPTKGAVLLANIAVQLPDINFLFVGKGHDYPILKKLSQSHHNIKLLGNVPYTQLHLYYNLANVFCLPSLYNEGWGRVLMEALACGFASHCFQSRSHH